MTVKTDTGHLNFQCEGEQDLREICAFDYMYLQIPQSLTHNTSKAKNLTSTFKRNSQTVNLKAVQ